MRHLNEYMIDLNESGGVYRNVQFDLVISTGFYDGPERGFAFHCSGEGAHFSVLGECKYPILRAFEIVSLDGNWKEQVKKVTDTSVRGPSGWMVFSSKSDDAVSALEGSASGATERSYYVGVGHAYLNKLAISAISKTDLDALKVVAKSRDVYVEVHDYIKNEGKRHGVKFYKSQQYVAG